MRKTSLSELRTSVAFYREDLERLDALMKEFRTKTGLTMGRSAMIRMVIKNEFNRLEKE
jgi:hypothetical protein